MIGFMVTIASAAVLCCAVIALHRWTQRRAIEACPPTLRSEDVSKVISEQATEPKLRAKTLGRVGSAEWIAVPGVTEHDFHQAVIDGFHDYKLWDDYQRNWRRN